MSDNLFTSLNQWFPQYPVFPIWPERKPNVSYQAHFNNKSLDAIQPDREISKVIDPEIMVVTPSKPNGIGMLVIPGGGYQRVAFDKEGVDTAQVLSAKGYTVFVITYRMPAGGHEEGSFASLADAQRAIRTIRSQMDTWSLQTLGVIGFSAGGHVAASLANRYAFLAYEPINEIDRLSARPDFAVLMYPVISMDTTIVHTGSRIELLGHSSSAKAIQELSMETQVHSQTPPCLLIHAGDDLVVHPENSVVFWQALKKNRIQTELHLFEAGGHGFGIRDAQGLPVQVWPELLNSWLLHHFY